MNSIYNILGKNWSTIKLNDNETSYGGKAHHNETLGEFCATCNIDVHDMSIGFLQKTLRENGIQELDIADSKIQEKIQDKIDDIEEELGVFINFKWDYW